MKNYFLKLIEFFLIIKMIESYDCPENNINNCRCSKNIDNDEMILLSCNDDFSDTENSKNSGYFEISISPSEVIIKCFDSTNLVNFHNDFRFLVKSITPLVLDNCTINENTDLKKIIQLTGTHFLSQINLANNSKLNVILIENKFEEFSILLGLNVTNRNDLQVVSENLLKNTPNLHYLTITRCLVETIAKNAFSRLWLLAKLDLSQNKLKYIEPETFKKLGDLTDLDLSENNLESLDDNIFQNLRMLKNLNLRRNKLTTISELLLRRLSNLKLFNADENSIKNIHKNAFIHLSKLEQISLVKNNLSDLSMENKQTHMGPIEMWNNYSIFASCINLQLLDLSFNNIQEVYDDWIDLSGMKLKNLQLSHNHILFLKLRHDFTMKSNFHIDLTDNYIKSINLFYLSSAKFDTQAKMYIDVRRNPFICNCVNEKLLQYIKGNMESIVYNHLMINADNVKCTGPKNLQGKKLSTLNSNDLSCQVLSKSGKNKNNPCTFEVILGQKLTKINCANRSLTKVPENLAIVSGFSSELNLENNNFKSIPRFNFSEPKSITKLHLSGNKIRNLNGIEKYENLEILELDNNEIQEIHDHQIQILTNLEHLIRVTLKGNPFICGPNFQALKNFNKIEGRRNNLSCRQRVESVEKYKNKDDPKLNSKPVKDSVCSLSRDEVEKIWDDTCSIY